MNKLLDAFKTRPDIDLSKYPGLCAFPLVPLSLLTLDGSFIVLS